MPRRLLVLLLLAACTEDGGLDSDAVAGPDVPDTPDITTSDTRVPDLPAWDTGLVLLSTADDLPGLSGQATTRGVRIGTLKAFEGRLYVGYGDYSNNTGPIAVLSYDPIDREFAASEPVTSEEVLQFHAHAGDLFTPDIDPTGHQAEGSAFKLGSDGQWSALTPIDGAVHTYALVTFEDRLWASTASITNGVARLASTSDASTSDASTSNIVGWRDEHVTTSPEGTFTRYTHLGVAGGALFASGFIKGAPNQPFAYRYDGAEWATVGNLPTSGSMVPLNVGGAFVIANFNGDVGKGGTYLGAYRMSSGPVLVRDDEALPAGVVNWTDGHHDDEPGVSQLLARTEGISRVFAPQDGGWVEPLELPLDADFSAIESLDGVLYLGTAQGAIYRYSAP